MLKLGRSSRSAYSLRRVIWPDPCAIKEKTNSRWLLALSLAEGIHKFLQLRTPLDLEKDLVVVICHLDIKVFDRSRHGLRGKVGHFSAVFRRFCVDFACVDSVV